MSNRDGFHVAGLLLFEGADEQQQYAEALRQRFGLEFDHMTVSYLEDELETMTAAAIENCTYGDSFPIPVVGYLLLLPLHQLLHAVQRGKHCLSVQSLDLLPV